MTGAVRKKSKRRSAAIRSTPRPRRRQRADEQSEPAAPKVLLLGAGPRVEDVATVCRKLGLAAEISTEPRRVARHVAPGVRLIVVVPPLPDLSAEDFCRKARLRLAGAGVPLLVVGAPPRHCRRLYRAGASEHFAWPGEKAALVRALLRLAGFGFKRTRRRSARDVALTARVEERVKAERATFGPLVKVRVRQGTVYLGGEVDAAWKVSALKRVVEEMPGVDEVVVGDVRVPTLGVPDSSIVAAIRTVLRHASGIDHRKVRTQALDGHVTVRGEARSARERKRIRALIEQVAGVRSVDVELRVGHRAGPSDRRLGLKLARLIERQFPKARVEARVHGQIVILSGKAADPRHRREIENLVADQPGVERVINRVS